jgi:hypothetical protein
MPRPYDVALTRRRADTATRWCSIAGWGNGRSATFHHPPDLVREFAVLIRNGIERGMPWLKSKVKDAPIRGAIARPRKTASIVGRIARAVRTARRLRAIAVTRSARQSNEAVVRRWLASSARDSVSRRAIHAQRLQFRLRLHDSPIGGTLPAQSARDRLCHPP